MQTYSAQEILGKSFPALPKTRENLGLTRLAVFAGAALFGALFGAICCLYMDSGLSELLKSAQENNLAIRRSGELSKIVLTSLGTSGAYLAAAFVLGFSAVGQPFEIILAFVKGIGSGVVLTQVYGMQLSASSLSRAAAIFPGTLISLVVLIFACRKAMSLSNRLFGICFCDRMTNGLYEEVKNYLAFFAVLLAALSFSAALDTALAIVVLG